MAEETGTLTEGYLSIIKNEAKYLVNDGYSKRSRDYEDFISAFTMPYCVVVTQTVFPEHHSIFCTRLNRGCDKECRARRVLERNYFYQNFSHVSYKYGEGTTEEQIIEFKCINPDTDTELYLTGIKTILNYTPYIMDDNAIAFDQLFIGCDINKTIYKGYKLSAVIKAYVDAVMERRKQLADAAFEKKREEITIFYEKYYKWIAERRDVRLFVEVCKLLTDIRQYKQQEGEIHTKISKEEKGPIPNKKNINIWLNSYVEKSDAIKRCEAEIERLKHESGLVIEEAKHKDKKVKLESE